MWPPRTVPPQGGSHREVHDTGHVVLDEKRFTGDPLAQPEPEYEFDQRVSWGADARTWPSAWARSAGWTLGFVTPSSAAKSTAGAEGGWAARAADTNGLCQASRGLRVPLRRAPFVRSWVPRPLLVGESWRELTALFRLQPSAKLRSYPSKDLCAARTILYWGQYPTAATSNGPQRPPIMPRSRGAKWPPPHSDQALCASAGRASSCRSPLAPQSAAPRSAR
jgi:hypothetical protein